MKVFGNFQMKESVENHDRLCPEELKSGLGSKPLRRIQESTQVSTAICHGSSQIIKETVENHDRLCPEELKNGLGSKPLRKFQENNLLTFHVSFDNSQMMRGNVESHGRICPEEVKDYSGFTDKGKMWRVMTAHAMNESSWRLHSVGNLYFLLITLLS